MADMQGRLPDGYSASCRCELDDARTGSLVWTPYILCANTAMDGFCLAVAVNFACNTSKQDRRACLWGKTVSSIWQANSIKDQRPQTSTSRSDVNVKLCSV